MSNIKIKHKKIKKCFSTLFVFVIFSLMFFSDKYSSNTKADDVYLSFNIHYNENNFDYEKYQYIKNDFEINMSCDGVYEVIDHSTENKYWYEYRFKKGTRDIIITIQTKNQNYYIRNKIFDDNKSACANGIYNAGNYSLRVSSDCKKMQVTSKYPKTSQGSEDYNILFSLSINPCTNPISNGTVDQNGGTSYSAGGDFTSSAVVGLRPENTSTSLWVKILEGVSEFRELINLITNITLAIAILTSVLITIINVMKFSTSSSHPVLRREASINLLTCAICIALLAATKYISVLIIDLAM